MSAPDLRREFPAVAVWDLTEVDIAPRSRRGAGGDPPARRDFLISDPSSSAPRFRSGQSGPISANSNRATSSSTPSPTNAARSTSAARSPRSNTGRRLRPGPGTLSLRSDRVGPVWFEAGSPSVGSAAQAPRRVVGDRPSSSKRRPTRSTSTSGPGRRPRPPPRPAPALRRRLRPRGGGPGRDRVHRSAPQGGAAALPTDAVAARIVLRENARDPQTGAQPGTHRAAQAKGEAIVTPRRGRPRPSQSKRGTWRRPSPSPPTGGLAKRAHGAPVRGPRLPHPARPRRRLLRRPPGRVLRDRRTQRLGQEHPAEDARQHLPRRRGRIRMAGAARAVHRARRRLQSRADRAGERRPQRGDDGAHADARRGSGSTR